jgi:hypothetical protein
MNKKIFLCVLKKQIAHRLFVFLEEGESDSRGTRETMNSSENHFGNNFSGKGFHVEKGLFFFFLCFFFVIIISVTSVIVMSNSDIGGTIPLIHTIENSMIRTSGNNEITFFEEKRTSE